MSSLNSEIESRLLEQGASLAGFANIRALPEEVRESMPFAISIAVALDGSIIKEIRNGPTREYFDEYKKANKLLSDLAHYSTDFLKEKGYKAFVIEPTLKLSEMQGLSTPLPHKTVATRAGLGWVGKSNLLITKKFGSAIRLSTVLTDAPLDVAEPIDNEQCDKCNLCVTACPAQALKGQKWQPGQEREIIVDVYACCDMARQLCKKIELEATICGICINVCPWTPKYISKEIQSQKQ